MSYGNNDRFVHSSILAYAQVVGGHQQCCVCYFVNSSTEILHTAVFMVTVLNILLSYYLRGKLLGCCCDNEVNIELFHSMSTISTPYFPDNQIVTSSCNTVNFPDIKL